MSKEFMQSVIEDLQWAYKKGSGVKYIDMDFSNVEWGTTKELVVRIEFKSGKVTYRRYPVSND